MMKCYYQGCAEEGCTKEHLPPKAFFPKNQRHQLITVRACKDHNTEKSGDDIYALAQICLNSSPRDQSRDVFMNCIMPQLGFNKDAFRKLLSRDSVQLADGAVKYKVDINRLDKFFDALSCGLIYHVTKEQLPQNFSIRNIYYNFMDESLSPKELEFKAHVEQFYQNETPQILHFGDAKLLNKDIYTAKIFGITRFQSSITILHLFFGHFKVITMLTRILSP